MEQGDLNEFCDQFIADFDINGADPNDNDQSYEIAIEWAYGQINSLGTVETIQIGVHLFYIGDYVSACRIQKFVFC